MIVQNDNVAIFTAEDIGKYDSDGNLLLKGAMFFQSDDKKMENIYGKVGLDLYFTGKTLTVLTGQKHGCGNRQNH
ncbi:hypothetical protein BH23THE1_BH23THE1_35870 [soil metagenome]